MAKISRSSSGISKPSITSRQDTLWRASTCGLTCNRCHTPARILAAGAPHHQDQGPEPYLPGTFPGLRHLPPGSAQRASRLRPASNATILKTGRAVSVGQFDHAKTRYPLTGLHAQVACAKCHTPGQDGKPRYTGIPFNQCTDCHSDPHHGSFAQGCQACHNTARVEKDFAVGG